MMNRVKSSLSAKIFIGIAVILLCVCLLMFFALQMFMPKAYESERSQQLTSNMQQLANELTDLPQDDWENLFASFCLENGVSAILLDEAGNTIDKYGFLLAENEGVPTVAGSMTYMESFEFEEQPFIIAVQVITGVGMQISSTFIKVFPYVLIGIIIISLLAAFIYSRILAKPIVEISVISQKMSALDMTWRCDINRSDEIGALAKNLNDMAARLNKSLKELQTANEKLEDDIENEREQERRRRDFFTAISHELKTPITILKGQIDGMILGVGKFKDRDMYLNEAYQTIESTEKLLKKIMMLGKLESVALRLEDIPLRVLTEDCYRIYEGMARDKETILNASYNANPIIKADKEQMLTVLSNIIGNAVRHSPSGSTVEIVLSESSLTIENTGVHLDREAISQIFQPFYRADKSRSRDTGGSGLGLYIVKMILELHEFEYLFENTQRGMSFTILF